MDLNSALELAMNGQALLFAGAGFSAGAINPRRSPFKRGRELAAHLALLCKLPLDTALDDAAEEFLARFGPDRLIQELKQEFTATEVTSGHLQIADIPWRRIYTTNYDNVLETAYQRASRPITPITLSDDVRQISKAETLCVHLNGFVDRLTRDNISSEVKLTDSSYLTASLVSSPWITLFRQDISLAHAIFFLGYSLADIDIKRILFETTALSDKCVFVLGPKPDAGTARRAARFGQVLEVTIADFASTVHDKALSYRPLPRLVHIPHCIQPYSAPAEAPSFSDRDVFDLLLLGSMRPELVAQSRHGGIRYFLERPAISQALTQLITSRVLVVHSELGNGKTLVLEGIRQAAAERGYSVYTVTQRAETLQAELGQVLASKEQILLMVDNYPDWLDLVEFFSLNANDRSRLVLSARSTAHDVLIDQLCVKLGVAGVVELGIDRLTAAEIDWTVAFLDEYGLWGANASLPAIRKVKLLSDGCHGQFHAILLQVLESPQILARFSIIFAELDRKRSYHDIVILVLVLAVLNYSASLDVLIDLCGEKVLASEFRRNPAIAQLIDFTRAEVRVKSATAAQFILKRIADPNVIVDVLVAMAKAADRAARVSGYHRGLILALMRFSNLQELLPEKAKRPAVIRYYEAIKTLDRCKTNPHFWLQYAVGCLVIEDLERAEKYFDTAYSFAKARDFEPYQIDNHYARFLLVKAIRSGDSSTCMAIFRKARAIIIEQVKEERLHYPYRVATSYGEFYDTFATALSVAEKQEIARAAGFVAKRIQALPEYRQRNRYVADCNDAMQYIIESVGIETAAPESAT